MRQGKGSSASRRVPRREYGESDQRRDGPGPPHNSIDGARGTPHVLESQFLALQLLLLSVCFAGVTLP